MTLSVHKILSTLSDTKPRTSISRPNNYTLAERMEILCGRCHKRRFLTMQSNARTWYRFMVVCSKLELCGEDSRNNTRHGQLMMTRDGEGPQITTSPPVHQSSYREDLPVQSSPHILHSKRSRYRSPVQSPYVAYKKGMVQVPVQFPLRFSRMW